MKKTRRILLLFIVLLVLSGVTAFPLKSEIVFLMNHSSWLPDFMLDWVVEVGASILATPDLVLYGTDWLAFAHIIIALFFIPVYLDPVKYKINLVIGMIACLSVFPLAFICGPIRGIPFFHQLIDCSFGVGGIILLYAAYKNIQQLEKKTV